MASEPGEISEGGVGRPVDPRAEMVVVLAQQGIGRNEIARRIGIPPVTVSAIAKANGIKFDRTKMAQPLKARLEDLKMAQLGAAEGLMEDLIRARTVFRMARTPRDYAFAAKAISDLTQSAQRMTPQLTNHDANESAKSLLGDLMVGITRVNQELEAREERGEIFNTPHFETQEENPNDES
ncbi:hypothetical protein ACIA8H_23315 [Streptomyces goshikiensis]|uniref:hypothetical protein n=1 Tax=Streptomyces goshikiensis TaxID=1942 RepID=UPI0037AEFBB5